MGENQWETREVEVDGNNSQVVLVTDGLQPGDQLAMNPGAFKELMDLPELELDRKIQISDQMKSRIDALKGGPQDQSNQIAGHDLDPTAKTEPPSGSHPGQPANRRGGGNRSSSSKLPASAAALIKDKDRDGDGKLSKDEIGTPFSFFFARIDTDQDGLLDEQEAEKSIQSMKNRMRQSGSSEGGPRL